MQDLKTQVSWDKVLDDPAVNGPRKRQTARKTTGGRAPRKQLKSVQVANNALASSSKASGSRYNEVNNARPRSVY